MLTWILCAAVMWSAAPEKTAPEPVPASVVLVVLDAPAPGVSVRLATMLGLIPQIRLLPPTAFPEERQDAIRKTLAGVAPYPDPLARVVLKKHLGALKASAVVLAGGRLYLQTAAGAYQGPFLLPGPGGKLPDALVERLCSLSALSAVASASGQPREPFYRNWLFWTGVGLIVGAMVTVSVLSRDAQDVEVEVFHR